MVRCQVLFDIMAVIDWLLASAVGSRADRLMVDRSHLERLTVHKDSHLD